MSFTAKCPSCRVKMRFPPEAAGASIECPRCHNFFTAAAAEEAVLPQRFRQLASVSKTVAEAPAAEAVGSSLTTDHSTQALPVSMSTAAPELPANRHVNLCGVVAFVFGSGGLLCASISSLDFLTIPMAALGLLAAGAGLLLETERQKGMILPGVGALVCLPVLALGMFWPRYLTESYGRNRTQAAPDSKKPLAIHSRGDHIHEPARPAGDEALPADRAGVRLGNGQVRVLRVVSGPVALSGRPEKPLPPENNLTVVLRVANVGTKGRLPYESWGAALRTRAAHAPILRDKRGSSYALTDFGPGVTVPGRFRSKDLLPGKFVNDRLVFPEPAAGAEEFVLELPATAIGGEGTLKFKILRSQITRGGPGIGPEF
jgi:hypothetical protein